MTTAFFGHLNMTTPFNVTLVGKNIQCYNRTGPQVTMVRLERCLFCRTAITWKMKIIQYIHAKHIYYDYTGNWLINGYLKFCLELFEYNFMLAKVNSYRLFHLLISNICIFRKKVSHPRPGYTSALQGKRPKCKTYSDAVDPADSTIRTCKYHCACSETGCEEFTVMMFHRATVAPSEADYRLSTISMTPVGLRIMVG